MKKILFAIMLTLATGHLSYSMAASAPKHRYQQGIEAYSDTTSVDTAANAGTGVDDEYDDGGDDDDAGYSKYSMKHYSDPFDYFGNVFGTGGVLVVTILCLVFGLLMVLSPFIIVLLVIRLLMRRHDDKVRLAEMAMEKGQPIPESEKAVDRQSSEYLVKRGLRNAFLGAGLFAMFMIWDSDFLAGIGALVFLYGLGQAVIGALPTIKEYLKNRQGRLE